MKVNGLIRKTDKIGRIVLPKEFRKIYNVKESDAFEFSHNEKYIIIKRPSSRCAFCDSAKKLFDFKGNMVCKKCLVQIKEKY